MTICSSMHQDQVSNNENYNFFLIFNISKIFFLEIKYIISTYIDGNRLVSPVDLIITMFVG